MHNVTICIEITKNWIECIFRIKKPFRFRVHCKSNKYLHKKGIMIILVLCYKVQTPPALSLFWSQWLKYASVYEFLPFSYLSSFLWTEAWGCQKFNISVWKQTSLWWKPIMRKVLLILYSTELSVLGWEKWPQHSGKWLAKLQSRILKYNQEEDAVRLRQGCIADVKRRY